MTSNQVNTSAYVLASKPSSSFSSISAASATSAGTSRSGCSKLLFGEIDLSSDRSVDSYASVCSFVLCDSSTFLKFWLEDTCRDTFLSFLSKDDLTNLRLVGHDFSVRAAPALFNDLAITLRASSFTRPSKLAALDRIGFYVKTLRFNLPHNTDSFLPPLIDPDTGEELSFSYTPQVDSISGPRPPKYGDAVTTEIVSRQYPPIFHAATNVDAFTRAFSCFVNLKHLWVACPGYDIINRYRRTVVDFALISLRIAVEKNCLNALDQLTLSPLHPAGLLYLAPILGLGASPMSTRRWSRIRHLTIRVNALHDDQSNSSEPSQFQLLQTFLRNYQSNLETLTFRWLGAKGHLPVRRPSISSNSSHGIHPALQFTPPHNAPHSPTSPVSSPTRPQSRPTLTFPKLRSFQAENIHTSASDIAAFVASHRRTIEHLDFDNVTLTTGSWDDALAPLTEMAKSRRRDERQRVCNKERKKPRGERRREVVQSSPVQMNESCRHGDRSEEVEEIPIMLSPTCAPTKTFPRAMTIVEPRSPKTGRGEDGGGGEGVGRRSLRFARWLPGMGKGTERVKDGMGGCEGGLRRVLRGGSGLMK